MARTVPQGADRGPRDKQVSVYLASEEVEELEKIAKKLGFKSKSTLIAYILEDLIADGFSGLVFTKLGSKFADLISASPDSKWAFEQLNPLRKKAKKPSPGEFEKDNPHYKGES